MAFHTSYEYKWMLHLNENVMMLCEPTVSKADADDGDEKMLLLPNNIISVWQMDRRSNFIRFQPLASSFIDFVLC